MSEKSSYFTAYSQGENQVTNNVTLMLMHLYNDNPKKFKEFLITLLQEKLSDYKMPDLGIQFEQQEKGAHSVLDAVVYQRPFFIHIEAKLGDDLNEGQLKNHMKSIKDKGGENNILLGLTKNQVETLPEVENHAKNLDINVAYITYAEILDALKQTIEKWQVGLSDILEDFEDYLNSKGLIPIEYYMVVVPCSTSHEQNLVYKVYYHPSDRSFRKETKYIGIYKNKTITHVGKIKEVIEYKKDKCIKGDVEGEYAEKIEGLWKDTPYYNLKDEDIKYYFVEKFHKVDLEKTSKGGVIGRRYLDLEKDIIGLKDEKSDFEGIVNQLQIDKCTWE